jgi:hypothetical protein
MLSLSLSTLVSLVIIVGFFNLLNLLWDKALKFQAFLDYKNGQRTCGRWVRWVDFEHELSKN